MSTHATTPIYTGPRTGSRLSDEQLRLLKTKLSALRRLSDCTGFSTSKCIVDLLSPLSQADLILLGSLFERVEPAGGNR